MTVRELIEKLEKFQDNNRVVFDDTITEVKDVFCLPIGYGVVVISKKEPNE